MPDASASPRALYVFALGVCVCVVCGVAWTGLDNGGGPINYGICNRFAAEQYCMHVIPMHTSAACGVLESQFGRNVWYVLMQQSV